MKKQLFLMAVVALAMASCSKDDSTGINKGSAIDFRVALGTRAAETTTSNLTTIFVTAIDKNNANLQEAVQMLNSESQGSRKGDGMGTRVWWDVKPYNN